MKVSKSRTINSVRNTSRAFISQGIVSVLAYITRIIFINMLGNTYLGLNGLFSDILTLLSLAELGIGTAINYSMYKPYAEKDYIKVSALLELYRKLYVFIGLIITIIGLCLTPFLGWFISDMPDISNLKYIYILYLLNTTITYFFSYKRSILIVAQTSYVISNCQVISSILQNVLQVIILLIFRNFIIYLAIQVFCTFINNLLISLYVDKNYKQIIKAKDNCLDRKTKKDIKKNIYAMFISKISSAVVTSTDNILISKFVSTIVLGVYSNYTLFTNLIRTVLTKIFESLTGSIGNLIAVENSEKRFEVYNKVWFLNNWLIGLMCIMLFVLIKPIICISFGEQYLLTSGVTFLICLNTYVRFMRNTLLAYVDAGGLFCQFKIKSIIEAVINLVGSLFFLKVFNLGLLGVLGGTLLSNICTNFWYEPYIVYKELFDKKLYLYFKKYIIYFLINIIVGVIVYSICNALKLQNSILNLSIQIIISFCLINILYCIIYFRTNEFRQCKNLLNKVLNRV